MKKIRWGVLSTAKIGIQKVIPATQRSSNGVVSAIASRTLESAKQAAQSLSIPQAYGSYEALIHANDIDAIYIPLPNHLHLPWTLKCLEAGKHVLCEKPFANNTADIQTLISAQTAANKLVGEAFMIQHHPQWQKAIDIIQSGELGEVNTVMGAFFYHNVDADNIRNQASTLGGALMDIGCYPILAARMIFNAEPTSVSAQMTFDANFKTDRLTSAVLQFPKGNAIFSVGTQSANHQRITIVGTQKRLEIPIPFNAPPNQATALEVFGPDILAPSERTITLPPCDQYTLQAEQFANAILNNEQPAMGLEGSFKNAAVLEAVILAAKTNTWTTPKPHPYTTAHPLS